MTSYLGTAAIAERAYRRYKSLHPLGQYPGILAMQGIARLALQTESHALLDLVRQDLRPFVAGEVDFRCNFMNYKCGGNGAAFLHWRDKLPQACDILRRYADELLHEAPRDENGIYCMRSDANRLKVWIDVAFAVSPFLLFCGLAFEDDACIEEAWQQSRKMYELFLNPANGLLHQSQHFAGPGKFSDDHWSRGNGWGILAMTELAHYLPEGDPRRAEARRMCRDHILACLKTQDADGLWHQDMTDHTSYVETSGTGLILYALGVALETSLVNQEARPALEKGLRGYLSYIGLDGSVHNTCIGCLCPGDGSAQAYKDRAHKLNDSHAFGPVILAFGQAHALGIRDAATLL